MKTLTLLLATFFLFLAIKPVIDTLVWATDTEQTCCGGQRAPVAADNHSQDADHDKGCEGKSCNPFQICSTCVLACCYLNFDYLPQPTTFTEKEFSYQTTYTSQFTSDFWQPPKIVS